ncbi:mediator of RNA polymerase II transcription subunit 15-like isoform X1 [Vespula squamosa]|uniref:Mediator of RNA polymerase II transcription subunit 15-like isoform X1 n=1 Tax=Vespula squamosa TaxID=30214 RepID=A0ABD2AEB5_VESSQ
MGCGQSKIGNIYPKNKKNKNNSNKKNGDSIQLKFKKKKKGKEKSLTSELYICKPADSLNKILGVVALHFIFTLMTLQYVKNCDKVEGHLASFFLMLPASKKKEASPLNIKRRGRRTSSRLENKQKGAKMWLKVLRQNISHLARRAKGRQHNEDEDDDDDDDEASKLEIRFGFGFFRLDNKNDERDQLTKCQEFVSPRLNLFTTWSKSRAYELLRGIHLRGTYRVRNRVTHVRFDQEISPANTMMIHYQTSFKISIAINYNR